MNPRMVILIGLAVYFLTVCLNRFLGERNLKLLSPEEKAKLVDEFSKHRSVATYLPIAILVAALAIIYFQRRLAPWVLPICAALVLAISLMLQFAILRRVHAIGLPAEYVSRFRLQCNTMQIGNVVSLALLTYGVVEIL